MEHYNNIDEAIWVAQELFRQGSVTGSTGNISFRKNNDIYISSSGSCFGRIDEKSFSLLSIDGQITSGRPSKEWPIHLSLYRSNEISAIIHTHSFYSVLLSCRKNLNDEIKDLYKYTPYLGILSKGNISVVDYYEPGSTKLFEEFNKTVSRDTNIYILRNHGIVVSAKSILESFYILSEFETTAKLLHEIENDTDGFNSI